MPKRAPTPHDNDAGLLAVRKNALTGKYVCLYEGAEQGLDTDGGRYSIVCSEHATVIAHTNKRDALWWTSNPAEWCEDCMAIQKGLKSLAQQIKDSHK